MENKIIYLIIYWTNELKYFNVNSIIFRGSTYLVHKMYWGSVIHKMGESIIKFWLIHSNTV